MSSLFNQVRSLKPNKNVFDLGHERKFSCDMGKLIPIMCTDVVPGDKFRVNTEVLIRLAPMIAPLMHRVNVYTHFFFVPNRLIWNDWQTFITRGVSGEEQPVHPYISSPAVNPLSEWAAGGLLDYLGYPVDFKTTAPFSRVPKNFNALPLRAYNLIYNEYYRNQNLQNEVPLSKLSGLDVITNKSILSRNWEKDYFTSCLPWPQRGQEITLPMAGSAPIVTDPLSQHTRHVDGTPVIDLDISSAIVGPSTLTGLVDSNGDRVILHNDGAEVDLTEATGVTINNLRRSIRLQEWLERSARAGSRYIETILSHFGVLSSDARLQRPEFLGGGRQPVTFSEVLQTSESAETAQGNMAGHGLSVGGSHSFSKYFEEHGYVIGIMSIVPKTAYQTNTPRHLLRESSFDYFWPEFANIGEQEVKNREVYEDYSISSEEGEDTFGYQSRYAEYKYIPSSVHGDFKTNLSFWHMGRMFTAKPNLNEEFVKSNPRKDVFAVSGDNTNKCYVYLYNDVKAIRPMPKFGTPTL